MKTSNISKKTTNNEIWTDECEALLAEWSEKASCYRWLHGRSEKNYRIWYYCFSIPVIILSTLTGAANVGMDSFVPAEKKSMASAIVGGVNIFAGIISTLQNFLKVAELMEAHRIAGVSWGKLQRNIAIELALHPTRRIIQTDFLKMSRAEYDRLLEAGPIIDDGIIAQFNKKFNNYDVAVPSICNGLDKCVIYKIDKNIKMNEREFEDGIEDIIDKQEKEINKELDKRMETLIVQNKSEKDDFNESDEDSNKSEEDDFNESEKSSNKSQEDDFNESEKGSNKSQEDDFNESEKGSNKTEEDDFNESEKGSNKSEEDELSKSEKGSNKSEEDELSKSEKGDLSKSEEDSNSSSEEIESIIPSDNEDNKLL